jgi:hypothetical protein
MIVVPQAKFIDNHYQLPTRPIIRDAAPFLYLLQELLLLLRERKFVRAGTSSLRAVTGGSAYIAKLPAKSKKGSGANS